MDINKLYDIFLSSNGVTTDSRAVKSGEIFFALRGENFDGNNYVCNALDAGASYAVVAEDSAIATNAGNDERIIPVADTLVTLKELAALHRNSVRVNGKRLTVVGLTGTNGKTTTKELIRSVLSKKFKVTATEGNLNNEIGVPLSVLKINTETEIAVIEMGASHPGDIQSLVAVSQPDFGLITNVGKGHLLGFGSLDGVKRTKGELYDYVAANGGKIFLNEDLIYLREMAEVRGIEDIISYGVGYEGVKLLPVGAENPCLKVELPLDCSNSLILQSHLVGNYNADNIMAALAVGRYFGVTLADAVSAIEEYVPANNRSQMQRTANNLVIVDAYNANPVSMKAALRSLESMFSDCKAVMLGDMLELGAESGREHTSIIHCVTEMQIDKAFLVGEEFRKALDSNEIPEKVMWFKDSAALSAYLETEPLKGYTVLVKGSRGVRMEKVLASL